MNKQYFQSYLQIAPSIITAMFPLASYAPKSIPQAGSPCRQSSDVRFDNLNVIAVVAHKSGDFTVKTPSGNIRFWKAV